MDAVALLALIGDLYKQVSALQAENAHLMAQIKATADGPGATDAD